MERGNDERHHLKTLYQLLAYFRYWLRSGTAHGLHSPFVYGLYTTVICHDGEFSAFPRIEARAAGAAE